MRSRRISCRFKCRSRSRIKGRRETTWTKHDRKIRLLATSHLIWARAKSLKTIFKRMSLNLSIQNSTEHHHLHSWNMLRRSSSIRRKSVRWMRRRRVRSYRHKRNWFWMKTLRIMMQQTDQLIQENIWKPSASHQGFSCNPNHLHLPIKQISPSKNQIKRSLEVCPKISKKIKWVWIH